MKNIFNTMGYIVSLGLVVGVEAFSPVEVQAAQESTEVSRRNSVEEIIVTARRREENLMEIPESISVFGEQAIEEAEIDEIADFARLTPGVVVQQGFQGGDRPIVVFRGVGQIGGTAPSVVMLSDGIYMPNGDPLRNQLFDIQRIEVVKGPQSSLYGRDAIGGVINVISKAPSEEVSGGIQTSYLTKADQGAIRGSINVPLVEGKLYSRLSGGYLESDGFFENATGQDHDFREESYVRARLLYTPSEALEVDFRLGYNKYNNSYNAAFFSFADDVYYDDIGSLNAIDFTEGFNERKVWDSALKVEIDFDSMTFTSISQIVDGEQNLVQDADFSLAPGLQIVRDSLTKDDTWSQEFRLASSGEGPFQWLAGVFYEENDLEFSFADTELNVIGFLNGGANQIDTQRWAVFSQLDFDLTDRLTASAALRYDEGERDLTVTLPAVASAEFKSDRVTPKFSLRYSWSEQLSAYVTYAEGFRSGGFDPVTNIPYNDEELESYEVGIKSDLLEGQMYLTLAAYMIDYTDQQVAVLTTDPVSGNLLVTTENLGASETRGVELALQYHATDNLVLDLSADIMDTEIKTDPDPGIEGNDTPFSTDFTVSASGQHTYSLGSGLNLVSRLAYYYQGDQTWDKGNTMVQDAYGVLSARLALESTHWVVALSGENLLDEEYNDQIFTNFAIPGLNAVYPGLPRRWTVSFSAHF